MWEKTLGLPKPLCISPQFFFFAFKFLTCIIRSWLLSLLKEYATRHIWPRKVDTCFLNTFERDERTESEVTQRPSYAAETTQDVAVMMQGMFHVKRKVPGLSSLARCDGPSVWSARSFTRTELHWNCCWMRTMTWVFPPTSFSDWWVRKVKTSQKSIKFLTDIGESEKCFHKVELFNLKKLLYIVVIRKVGQKLQISDQQIFFNLTLLLLAQIT